MKLIAITIALVAAGCVPMGLPAADADGGTTPITGIYQLSESSTGDCQPAIADDRIDAYVDAEGAGAMVLAMSSPWFGPPGLGESVMVVGLPGGTLTQDLDPCGASLHMVLTVEDAAPDHLRVRRVDTFTDVAARSCALPILPSNDCTFTTELDYQLTQPCPKACIQLDVPDGEASAALPLRCTC